MFPNFGVVITTDNNEKQCFKNQVLISCFQMPVVVITSFLAKSVQLNLCGNGKKAEAECVAFDVSVHQFLQADAAGEKIYNSLCCLCGEHRLYSFRG